MASVVVLCGSVHFFRVSGVSGVQFHSSAVVRGAVARVVRESSDVSGLLSGPMQLIGPAVSQGFI